MSWASDFPDALRYRPYGLVILAGLETTYNAVHKAIWDLFCNNRKPDRVPLNFVTKPVDHEYPKPKAKRSSYEWYTPKGILQRDWMTKHLNKVPSLIITFFDLDWDDPHWNERLIECASRLNIIRNSIEKRSTKLAAVLIQRSPPLPPGEDSLASDRAAAFCAECELSPKSLFVLPQTDHLFGYIIRLENAFLELCQNYYTTNIRRVKAHRDYLNRTTHQVLFIRHQFKIAFFNELKQDTQMALKHYKQAYGYCLETKVNDQNNLEVKAIAGFINYKICSLAFYHNTPLDAIEQLRKHVDYFKPRIGPPNLAFEHSAWVSKQLQLFAEVFDNAIKRGLKAVQTQHPGFYYLQAANHSITRKQLCIGLCQPTDGLAPSAPVDHVEFYGHRPFPVFQQQGATSMEGGGWVVSDQAVHSLQALELQTDHSGEIINLLTSAVNHFQKHRSTRMKLHLLVMIGEEHYYSKAYKKALQILTSIAQDYRKEKWYSLLTAVLATALKSAYLLADVENYITLSLEFMAEKICRSAETKCKVQSDLLQLICGQVPDPQPGCDSHAVELANKEWQLVVNSTDFVSSPLAIDMANILSFIEYKVCFMQPSYKVDEDVELRVYIKCKSHFPLRFSELRIMFNDSRYDAQCVVKDEGDLRTAMEQEELSSRDLFFLPNETKSFIFTLQPNMKDMNKSLQVTNIHLKFVSTITVTLNFKVGASSVATCGAADLLSLRDADTMPSWDVLPVNNHVSLQCRTSELKVTPECHSRCLLNEHFPITWLLVNNETSDITTVRCSYTIKDTSVNTVLSIAQDDAQQSHNGSHVFCLEQLKQGEQVETKVYLQCREVGRVDVTASVVYNIGTEEFYKSADVHLEVVEPFRTTSRFLSTKLEDRLTVNSDEPFLLQFNICNISEYPLFIQNAQLLLSSHVPAESNQTIAQIVDLVLGNEEEATEFQCLVIPEPSNKDIIPGEYKIAWRREESDDKVGLVETTVSLPALTVEHQPLYIECDLPAYGVVYKPLQIVYTLYNKTSYVQEFEASMDSCDSFAFSGHKQLHFRTLPHASHSISYTIYPLSSGNLSLPPFKLQMMNNSNMSDIINKLIPQSVYVMPVDYAAAD